MYTRVFVSKSSFFVLFLGDTKINETFSVMNRIINEQLNKEEHIMKFSRTGEIVLGVIGAVLTTISIILLAIFVSTGSAALNDPTTMAELEQEIVTGIQEDPTLGAEEQQMVLDFVESGMGLFGIFGWGLVITLVISLIFNILAILNIRNNKNPKLAGIFFILAGLFAYLLSFTSILLYIAAIMSFVRKAPYTTDTTRTSEDLDYYEPNRPL